MTNTVEQLLMSFISQLITSTWLEPSQMSIIPIVVGLFVVGRIVFWRGYVDPANNHTNRALGLPWTVYPTLMMLMYSTCRLAASFFS
jgi:hypothetical protein